MLLLYNILNHLKNDIFNRLKHYCLEGGETLVNFFGDGKVVEAQLFGDFILEGLINSFFERSIVSFDHLEKVVVEKFETMVDFSFEMEVVVSVVVE